MWDLLRIVVATAIRVFVPRAALVAENLLLRQQLIVLRRHVKRPPLRRWDRFLLAKLAACAEALRAAVIIVRPETLLRWHRAGWRLFWARRSRRPVGRPPLDADLRALIRRMWRDNPLWGENRIAGECAKLGWHVSPRTVAKYRPSNLDRSRGQPWSTFLRNHLGQTWACDFFTIVTVRFQLLYAFVIISLERREIVHVGVTEHPSATWTAQRFVEAVIEHGGAAPRFVIHDRDSIYGVDFRLRLRGLGVRRLVTPPRAPRANAMCERLIGTLRRDCLDHILVWNDRHAERVLRDYVGYYHGRPHRSLRMQPPAGARWLAPPRPPPTAAVTSHPILGGLHHLYGIGNRASSTDHPQGSG